MIWPACGVDGDTPPAPNVSVENAWLGEFGSLPDPAEDCPLLPDPRLCFAAEVTAPPEDKFVKLSLDRWPTEEMAPATPAARWYGWLADPERERLLGLGGRDESLTTTDTRGESEGE
jgi:hypothetical protein